MHNYKKFCEDKIISDVIVSKNNIPAINIVSFYFKNNNGKLNLVALGDCCSSSWFHFFDNTDIDSFSKGKTIRYIKFLHDIEMVPSGIQDRDLNHLYQIIFSDGTNYDFVLRNSSNGYYDGWIDVEISDSLYPQ